MTSAAEATPSAANPFAALGLPATFVPTTPIYDVGRLEAIGPSGERLAWHVVIFKTADGIDAHAFTDDEARVLVEQLTAQVSGLTVAREMPAPSIHRWSE